MPLLPRYDADGSYRGLHRVVTPVFPLSGEALSEALSAPPASEPSPAPADSLPWAELRAEAKERAIPGYSRMKRPALEAAVEAARVGG